MSAEREQIIADFKKFLKENRELVLANTVEAEDIGLDDEWMQDDEDW